MADSQVPLSQEVFQQKFLEMHEICVRMDERLKDYPEIKQQVIAHESIVKTARWASVPALGLLHLTFKHLFGKL